MRPGYESDSSDSSSEDLLQLVLEEEEELRRQKKRKLQKALLLATLALSVGLYDQHHNHFYRNRIKWVDHVSQLNAEGPNAFFAMYRMHYPAYMKLCEFIHHAVMKNFEMAKLRTGNSVDVITTPIALHCCLRWLSGGSYHDIRLTAGMGKSSFYNYAHRCISAIIECDALAYKFPTTPMEVERAAQDFKAISSHGVMEGCVAAMDGILIKTITPAKSQVGNVRAFFSGHYQHYGINVQVNQCLLLYLFILNTF